MLGITSQLSTVIKQSCGHAGILAAIAAHSAGGREALLAGKPTVLPLLTSAVDGGTPALATLCLGMPPSWTLFHLMHWIGEPP